ncbi:MAG: uracil-DNA glycosylase family protein [Salibacteraceae bacterium]
MKTTGQKILEFYKSVELNSVKEKGVGVMNPFLSDEVLAINEVFYNKFFNDSGKRIFMIAINPGRFGAGVTGIPFTDPVELENEIGIPNSFQKRKELSAVFIHDMIQALGGFEQFYNQFYITNVSPLGFVKDGKNLNYYDIPNLQKELEPFIIRHMNHQVKQWGKTHIAFTIGKGKNFKAVVDLNKKHHWFDKIIALPHPRWVMQYRLKSKDLILDEVIQTINKSI